MISDTPNAFFFGSADASPSNGAGSSVAVPEAPRTKPGTAPVRPKPDVMPEWRVLLHNDDRNDMDYVVDTVVKIARLNRPSATRCMIEAHKKGMSQVVVTHRERAEFLAEQFRSCRLVVTIEPV
jgi:ATP-dependent Clp protease adapter protein ClpS